MPLIEKSAYTPPFLFSSGHVQTIYPTLYRKVETGFYRRERIDTPDGDFLDIDWSVTGSKSLAILSHGLEGSSKRAYMAGMTKALNRAAYDVLAWNFRGCGGETNRLLRFYHNGVTDDLDTVIRHALDSGKYSSIYLIGFSMGGNITLIYLGQNCANLLPEIRSAAVFSVPCGLEDSAKQLEKRINRIYMNRFLQMLHEKIIAKMKIMPDIINDADYDKIKNFRDFDNRYTAPIHGFKDAEDYWEKCSSKYFIPDVRIPVLIVNAKNDPFLAGSCYPVNEAKESGNVFLETPGSGGHVGFMSFNRDGQYWLEKRAVEFLSEHR